MLGLGLSLTHCFFMCGGIILLFNHKKSNFFDIFIYHFSRICAYILIGLIAYFLGYFLNSLNLQVFLYFILGAFCVVLGFALIVKGQLLAFIENQFIYKKIMLFLNNKKTSKYKGFIFGFLNGFFPCGLVYFFVAKSMIAKSVNEAWLNMLIFGLSTLPAMLLGSIFINKIRKIKNIQYLFFALIIVYGFYLCFLALKLSR